MRIMAIKICEASWDVAARKEIKTPSPAVRMAMSKLTVTLPRAMGGVKKRN